MEPKQSLPIVMDHHHHYMFCVGSLSLDTVNWFCYFQRDYVPETKTVFHLFDTNHFAAPMTFVKVYFASTLGIAKSKL